MNIASSVVDGWLAVAGMIAGLTLSVWALKASESTTRAYAESQSRESQTLLKKTA